MKKTVSVNIKGMNFLIEEDAYEILQRYIQLLTSGLQNDPGSKEIIEDIELRIAELCSEQLNDRKQVIEKEDIEKILSTLGDPSQYIDDSDNMEQKQYTEGEQVQDKRLFRDPDNGTIAGVCAGISNYLNIDVVIIRAIFAVVFLFGGFGLPLYIVLWIIIPKATSTIDKLRMRGKAVTVDSVKEEVELAAQRITKESKNIVNRIRKDDTYKTRISSIGRLFSILIGSGMMAFGLFLLVIFLIFGVGGFQFIPVQSEYGFLSFTELGELVLESRTDYNWALAGGLITGFSVILFILLLGTKLVFHIRNVWSKMTLGFLFFTGILGTIICIYVGVRTGREMMIEGEIERSVGSVATKELNIETIKPKMKASNSFEIKSKGRYGMMSIESDKIVESGIHVEYRLSPDSLFHIYQNLTANSKSHRIAVSKAKNIQHQVELVDNLLKLNAHYSFPKTDKLRDQDVVIIVEVPIGGSVKWNGKSIIPQLNGNSLLMEKLEDEEGYIESSGEYEHWD